MRIVHLSDTIVPTPPKKTPKELRHERCVLWVANQYIKDAKEAKKWREKLEANLLMKP